MPSLAHSASVLAVNSAFSFEAGSLSVALAGLKLVLTGELPASVSDVLRLKARVHFYTRRLIMAVSVQGRASASQGRGCGLLCCFCGLSSLPASHTLFILLSTTHN